MFNEVAVESILCFHGFDQRGDIFQKLAQQNPEKKVIGITLFGHGESIAIPQDEPLPLTGYKNFITQIIEAENIRRFDLAGYSLGARYALATYQLFSDKIYHLYLLAPDGIIPNYWFLLATSNGLLRKNFYWLMQSSKQFSGVAGVLQKLKIIRPSLARFVQQQLLNPDAGLKVYNAWVSSSELKLSPKTMAKINAKKTTKIQFILAQNDPLISQQKIQKIVNQIPSASLVITKKTHLQLGLINFLNPTF